MENAVYVVTDSSYNEKKKKMMEAEKRKQRHEIKKIKKQL